MWETRSSLQPDWLGARRAGCPGSTEVPGPLAKDTPVLQPLPLLVLELIQRAQKLRQRVGWFPMMSLLEKSSHSCLPIYMKFMFQNSAWLGLSTLLAGVLRTDKSWHDLDASLTRLKGTISIIAVLSEADKSQRPWLCSETSGSAGLQLTIPASCDALRGWWCMYTFLFIHQQIFTHPTCYHAQYDDKENPRQVSGSSGEQGRFRHLHMQPEGARMC